MTPSDSDKDAARAWFWPALLVCAVVLLGIQFLFLPYPGLQQDEVLFVKPFLRGNPSLFAWHIGPLQIPVMLMDYVGALKTWLYWPVFRLWSPGVWSIRVPVCAVSALTILVFGGIVRRAAGPAVALLACILLVTDASFIFTNLFDWGPVALLLLGSVVVLDCGHRAFTAGSTRSLAGGALVAGLSLWYKAAFLFPLLGIIVAALVLYGRRIASRFSGRAYAVAAAAFVVGVSPLLIFNAGARGATFQAASRLEKAPVIEKLTMLRRTLDGRALEHYMFRSGPGEQIKLQGAPLADLVMSWYASSRLGPGSALLLFLVLSLAALPFLRSSPLYRLLLFAWLAFLIAALTMLLFRDAGAGPHHTILLYPAPQFIVGATAMAAGTRLGRSRSLALGVAGVIVASNIWLLGQFYLAARHNGFSVYWSDGLARLAEVVASKNLPAAFLDWGIQDGVRIASHDTVATIDDPKPQPGVLYVGHCPAYVIDSAANERFARAVAAMRLIRDDMATVRDREGTAVFCLFSLK